MNENVKNMHISGVVDRTEQCAGWTKASFQKIDLALGCSVRPTVEPTNPTITKKLSGLSVELAKLIDPRNTWASRLDRKTQIS